MTARDGARWRTVSVHYYDEAGKDALILDAVRPLFARTGHQVAAAHFLRHWRRGPHLRLNFRATGEAMAHTVLPALDRTVGAFLRARPSAAALDFTALRPGYDALAAAEHEAGPLWPPRPDNCVHHEPYDSRAGVLGGARAAAFVADFHTAATPAAFTALQAVRDGEQRLWTGFELMAATAHAYSGGGVRTGYLSYRAHAETHLARAVDQPALRAAWDRAYRTAGTAPRARLQRVVASPREIPHVAAWLDVLDGLRARAAALADAGAITMDHAPRPAHGTTPFLARLTADEAFLHHSRTSPAFRRYRLLLNLLYLQLTRLGIRPAERYLLGHLLAAAVEETYGVDASALLREQAARAAGPR